MGETNSTQVARNGMSFILVILSLIAVMIVFTESMLIPALPTIQAEFNTTATWTSWILSIYLVAGAVFTPIFGKLGDTYGKKKLLVICMSLHRRCCCKWLCVEYPELAGLQGAAGPGYGHVSARIRSYS